MEQDSYLLYESWMERIKLLKQFKQQIGFAAHLRLTNQR